MHLPVKATKLGRKLYWESSARIRRLPNATSTTETPEGVVTTVTGPALIEPNWGYVITAEGRLIEDSLRTNWRAPAPWRFATPDPHEFNRVRHKNSPEVRDFEEVVLLRDLYEWNYFHFHFDVLGRLGLLREYGIPTSTPIIVGRYAKELPFVQQMLSTGRLAERQWVIQDRFYVRAKTVHYCNTSQGFLDRSRYFLEEMRMPADPVGSDRVFLNRVGTGAREIVNIDAVRRVLDRYNFVEVDTAKIPFAEQVAVFQSTKHLVAVHGAGMTNIIYRRNSPLSILELYASNYNSFDFRTIAGQMDFSWTGLASSPGPGHPQKANLTVDIGTFDEHVRILLDQGH